MNYAEQAAYWYLRLNGFFPLTNFVVHASGDVERTREVDLLAVRLPNVHEALGGADGDWDVFLRDNLELKRPLGVVCEVKSGRYQSDALFTRNVLSYAIRRIGFTPSDDVGGVMDQFLDRAVVTLNDGPQLAKLVVARDQHDGPFLFRHITDVAAFLEGRVKKYRARKYADRMFFPDDLFQTLIEQLHRAAD